MIGVTGTTPEFVPPAGLRLPYAADPGSITGYLLERTATETPAQISQQLSNGFQHLETNVPTALVEEIVSCSDELLCFLVVKTNCNGIVQVTTAHSIARFSAGFGGHALQGRMLTLLGEMVKDQLTLLGAMVKDQLPMLVAIDNDPDEHLAHALAMEEVCVPSEAQVYAYFADPTAAKLMPAAPSTTEEQGGVVMNVSKIFPIPLAWAPYFLDCKAPYQAFKMGRALVASLDNDAQRTQATPLLDWLRVACRQRGRDVADRSPSILNQGFISITPDARVTAWMQKRVAPYRKEIITTPFFIWLVCIVATIGGIGWVVKNFLKWLRQVDWDGQY